MQRHYVQTNFGLYPKSSFDNQTITTINPTKAHSCEGISKSFEPNMERARNLDLFCFIFQRSPLPTPHTCPI